MPFARAGAYEAAGAILDADGHSEQLRTTPVHRGLMSTHSNWMVL
jgi:hypothetical protein